MHPLETIARLGDSLKLTQVLEVAIGNLRQDK